MAPECAGAEDVLSIVPTSEGLSADSLGAGPAPRVEVGIARIPKSNDTKRHITNPLAFPVRFCMICKRNVNVYEPLASFLRFGLSFFAKCLPSFAQKDKI
jgi:hypothetical protein